MGISPGTLKKVYGCKRQRIPLQHQDCNHLNVDVVYFFSQTTTYWYFLGLGEKTLSDHNERQFDPEERIIFQITILQGLYR